VDRWIFAKKTKKVVVFETLTSNVVGFCNFLVVNKTARNSRQDSVKYAYITTMFKKSADMPINPPINRESLGE
jgi:hypothetical protein